MKMFFMYIPRMTRRRQQRSSRNMISWAIPVVDNEDSLMGIVTVDDVLDVVQEEVTEDFQRMAGIQKIEEEYFRIGFSKRVLNRVSWLVILVIAATIITNDTKDLFQCLEFGNCTCLFHSHAYRIRW